MRLCSEKPTQHLLILAFHRLLQNGSQTSILTISLWVPGTSTPGLPQVWAVLQGPRSGCSPSLPPSLCSFNGCSATVEKIDRQIDRQCRYSLEVKRSEASPRPAPDTTRRSQSNPQGNQCHSATSIPKKKKTKTNKKKTCSL